MSSTQLTSSEIENLRQQIEAINTEIIQLIANRVKVAEKIGEHKKAQNKDVYQPDREKEVLQSCHKQATEVGLDGETIESIFAKIIQLSRKSQRDDQQQDS